MKFTAPIAIPTPNTMPARRRLLPPSPNANVTPPTTIDTRLRPRAMGPVKLVISTVTAFSHGDWAWLAAGTSTIAPSASRVQIVEKEYERTLLGEILQKRAQLEEHAFLVAAGSLVRAPLNSAPALAS